MAKTDDPWSNIAAPHTSSALSMRRTTEDGPWDFYWARDRESRCLLVLRGATASMPRARLPLLKGVEVFIQPATDDAKAALIIRLLDQTLRDIFFQLCTDIMISAEEAESEVDAVGRAVARTWRWHYLLRGGRGMLSVSEQLGLIGELLIVERFLLPNVSASVAVDAWKGPLGDARDFACGTVFVESKARGRSTMPSVRINSEHQLTRPMTGTLFLAVTVFDHGNADEQEGDCVSEVARRVRVQVQAGDERAIERFDALLEAAGLSQQHDYSIWRWKEWEQSIFHVKETFPRIEPDQLPAGVSNTRYDLWVPACVQFAVPRTSLDAALRGEEHV